MATKKCGATLTFFVPVEKVRHVLNAKEELTKAGVRFDTGNKPFDKVGTAELNWELDQSLEQAELKIKCSEKESKNEED